MVVIVKRIDLFLVMRMVFLCFIVFLYDFGDIVGLSDIF